MGVQHERSSVVLADVLEMTQEGELTGRWSPGVTRGARELLLSGKLPCCRHCWAEGLDLLERIVQRASRPRVVPNSG
jgi:hypothetical protein